MNIGYKIYLLVWVFQNILKLVRKLECKYTCKNESATMRNRNKLFKLYMIKISLYLIN